MPGITPAMNALLGAYDTNQERLWRVEDRQWRREEVGFRGYERATQDQELLHSEEQREWRKEDLEQIDLDNIQFLWDEFVQRTRAEVSLKSEQLKALGFLGAILAGFAMTSFNQFNYDAESFPLALNWAFGLTTALSVGFAMNSMMLSALVQSSMLKVHLRYISVAEEAAFYLRCYRFMERYQFGHAPPRPGKNFNKFWKDQCEGAFQRAFFMFMLAVPAFLINLLISVVIVYESTVRTIVVVNIVTAAGLVLYATSGWRWWQHVLGLKRAQQIGATGFKARGMPFDWHLSNPYFGRWHSTVSSGQSTTC